MYSNEDNADTNACTQPTKLRLTQLARVTDAWQLQGEMRHLPRRRAQLAAWAKPGPGLESRYDEDLKDGIWGPRVDWRMEKMMLYKKTETSSSMFGW